MVVGDAFGRPVEAVGGAALLYNLACFLRVPRRLALVPLRLCSSSSHCDLSFECHHRNVGENDSTGLLRPHLN